VTYHTDDDVENMAFITASMSSLKLVQAGHVYASLIVFLSFSLDNTSKNTPIHQFRFYTRKPLLGETLTISAIFSSCSHELWPTIYILKPDWHKMAKCRIPRKELRERLGLDDIISELHRNRLRWYGHVLWKEDNDWVKKCTEHEVEGARQRGRPKKTWTEIVEKDCQMHGLNREDAMDCSRWIKQIGTINDHDRCEWVNVSSGTGSPGLSWTKSIEP